MEHEGEEKRTTRKRFVLVLVHAGGEHTTYAPARRLAKPSEPCLLPMREASQCTEPRRLFWRVRREERGASTPSPMPATRESWRRGQRRRGRMEKSASGITGIPQT